MSSRSTQAIRWAILLAALWAVAVLLAFSSPPLTT
jgi:hypothetical protein